MDTTIALQVADGDPGGDDAPQRWVVLVSPGERIERGDESPVFVLESFEADEPHVKPPLPPIDGGRLAVFVVRRWGSLPHWRR
jgi:hypothetical protein